MSAKPKRRWYQFSLGGMLLFTTMLCVGPGTYIGYSHQKARRQLVAAASIKSAGGEVRSYASQRSSAMKLVLGDDTFARVCCVDCFSSANVNDATLANLEVFSGIDRLWLKEMPITDAGLVFVAPLIRLRELHLDHSQITDAGLVHLRGLPDLDWLTLDGTDVTDEGLRQLIGLPKLSTLCLDGTHVTDAGLMQLHELPSIDYVSLRKTKVTEAGLKALAQRLPHLRVNADPWEAIGITAHWWVRSRKELIQAVRMARPGTRIVLAPGTYEGGLALESLKGEKGKPIIIMAADPMQPPVIEGGASGLHLTDPAYVELRDLVMAKSRANGLNLDDGGCSCRPK